MDCNFKNDAHINKICSMSFLYIGNIIKVWHLMDNKTAQVVVQACKTCILTFKRYRDIGPKYLTELVSFDSKHNRILCSN